MIYWIGGHWVTLCSQARRGRVGFSAAVYAMPLYRYLHANGTLKTKASGCSG